MGGGRKILEEEEVGILWEEVVEEEEVGILWEEVERYWRRKRWVCCGRR